MSLSANVARRTILGLAQNRLIKGAMIRHGLRLGAARFVPGESLDEALQAVRTLNEQGIMATLDHLGEFVSEPSEAFVATEACLQVLDGIQRAGLTCNLSLKLTQLGLDIDPLLCKENVHRILTRAAEYGNFVRIDMEDSPRTDATLDLCEELLAEFGPARVGTVIQGYLYRSKQDLERLSRLGANVRMVKGAYMEPPSVAFPSKADVDANYVALIKQYLGAGMYTAIASQDERAIRAVQAYVAVHGIARDRFEFQMLYGIRRDLQRELVEQGYRVRVYVPFGTDWYGYFTRRLAERPANVMFVLGNMLKP